MHEIMMEEFLFITGGVLFLMSGLSAFLFGRISVSHIEKEMAGEGITPPVWDKGIGARMIAYAGIIVFPNLKRHASLVNIEATKRFARSKDKKLALFYLITTVVFLTILFTAYYLYGLEN
tara:strand:- start:411 stop:770 length:360 start_codon:yes stop_codon:yes gene_type:complete